MEVDEYDNSCLICLQTVTQTSEEHFHSLKSFYNYIKFHNEAKVAFVCEKCGEKLTKFAKLINILEKTRLEINYILDFVQSTITHSSKIKVESVDFASIRECLLEKCKIINCSQKAEIILEKIDQPKLIKKETSASECSDDWLPNEDDNNSSSSESCHHKGSAIVQVTDNNSIKEEINLEDNTKITKRGRKRYIFQNIKCAECTKSFSSSKSLSIHMDAVHLRLKPYMCDICGKSFARKDDLRRHRIRENSRINPQMSLDHVQGRGLKRSSSNTNFKCEKCSKTFVSAKNLRIHINAVHLNLKPYMCDICGKSFARPGELIRHSGKPHKTKEQNPNSESLPCEMCNKSFDNLRSLQVHKKYVHRERNFQCEICKKAFKTISALKLHVASVHEKERHSCQVEGCDISYAQSSLLIYHYRRKHPDFEIPPKSHPDKSYFRKSENGKIVVECKICACQFETAKKVMKHIRRRHSPKSFLCEECGYATPFSDKLTRHVKEVHLGLKKGKVVRKSIDTSV